MFDFEVSYDPTLKATVVFVLDELSEPQYVVIFYSDEYEAHCESWVHSVKLDF